MTISRTAKNSRRRGFTLVEFMVALTGGLFVSVAIFVLAKHSSRFYQRELRVGNATLSSMVGFERLRADIARAGYLSSPNIRRDPTVCGNGALYPGYLNRIASVFIEATTGLPALYAANGLAPQRAILVGDYSSVDQFPIRQVQSVGGARFDVYLQAGAGALELANVGYISGTGPAELPTLQRIFRVGRIARIVDKRGATQFGLISAVTGGVNPVVSLASQPALQFMATSGALNCGVHGHETGAYINPVDVVRYDIRSLSTDARYAPIYRNPALDTDADRRELVREEVDPSSTSDPPAAFAGTQELVAEYAMDLRFELTVAPTDLVGLRVVPTADISKWAGKPADHDAGQGPQLIRNIRTWLSVRSREADRLDGIRGTTAGGPLLRVALGSNASAPFARVRTVQSHVALRNQIGVTWR